MNHRDATQNDRNAPQLFLLLLGGEAGWEATEKKLDYRPVKRHTLELFGSPLSSIFLCHSIRSPRLLWPQSSWLSARGDFIHLKFCQKGHCCLQRFQDSVNAAEFLFCCFGLCLKSFECPHDVLSPRPIPFQFILNESASHAASIVTVGLVHCVPWESWRHLFVHRSIAPKVTDAAEQRAAVLVVCATAPLLTLEPASLARVHVACGSACRRGRCARRLRLVTLGVLVGHGGVLARLMCVSVLSALCCCRHRGTLQYLSTSPEEYLSSYYE